MSTKEKTHKDSDSVLVEGDLVIFSKQSLALQDKRLKHIYEIIKIVDFEDGGFKGCLLKVNDNTEEDGRVIPMVMDYMIEKYSPDSDNFPTFDKDKGIMFTRPVYRPLVEDLPSIKHRDLVKNLTDIFRADEDLNESFINKKDTTLVSNINHPKHYNLHPSGVECIEIVRHHNFNIGNAIKYLWRMGLKDSDTLIEDLKKAIWYLNDELKRLQK